MKKPARKNRGEQSTEPDGKGLPPTANRILRASKRVLEKKGYSGFTWKAISEEAGVNEALISYYFGSKAGLLEAVVESLFADTGIDPEQDAHPADDSSEVVHWLTQLQRRASSNRRVNRMTYELVPHALRTKRLRTRFSDLYKLHRNFDAECLESGKPKLDRKTIDSLAALTVAVSEGLAMQLAVDPEDFDHDGAYAVWESMLLTYLDEASRNH